MRGLGNSGAKVSGAALVKADAFAEMEALDRLPVEVRREICNARFQLKCSGLADLVSEYGVAAVVRAVKMTDEKIAAQAAAERGL